MKTTLITGASDGIGKDMAIILSNKGYNIIVVLLIIICKVCS